MMAFSAPYVQDKLIMSLYELIISTRSMIMLTCHMNNLHVNIIMLHVHLYKSLVTIIMLYVNIIMLT